MRRLKPLWKCRGWRLSVGCACNWAVRSAKPHPFRRRTHVAAYLDDVDFLEGSYGTLLLKEDVGRESINFGHGGKPTLYAATASASSS